MKHLKYTYQNWWIVGDGVDPSPSPSWSSGPPHGQSSPHHRPAGKEARRQQRVSERDIGVSVVCMCWHVKRWFILCVCALQSGHIGVGCVSGKITWRYSFSSEHFFALSYASVLLVYLGCVSFCVFNSRWGVIYYLVVCTCL